MSTSEDEQCKDLLQKIASIAGLINRSKYINKNVAIAKKSSSNSSTYPTTFSYPNKNTSRKNLSLVTPSGQVNMRSPIPMSNTSYVRRGNKLVRNSSIHFPAFFGNLRFDKTKQISNSCKESSI